jgi:hypothetical protein
MSHGIGSSVIPVAVFLVILLIALPVSAANVTISQTTVATNQTTVPPSQTAATTTQTTVLPSQTTFATNQTTLSTTQTIVATTIVTDTPMTTTIAVTQPTMIITTANPTISGAETETTGSLMVYSSPTGASILIDGVYSGITPETINGVPAGNHILRLVLSGYYDYEGSIYIVPGQSSQGYGTLQPISQVTSVAQNMVPTGMTPDVVPVVTVTPGPTQDAGLLGNTNVLVAIIGFITVLIAVAASIFIQVTPPKKE